MKKFFNKILLLSAVIGLAANGFALSACGETDVGPHEHIYGGWTVISPATCSENGKRTHTCAVCHEAEEEEIPALGHDFDGGRETKAASCTQTGERTQTCRRCKTVITSDVSTSPHNWDAGTVLVKATCKEKGSMKLICKDCGTSQTVDLGYGPHDPVETKRVEAKCETAGSVSYRCSVCEETLPDVEIPKLGHRWKLGEHDVEPTCTTDGYRDRVCERCGTSEQQTIGKLGHELPEEYTIDKFPTFEDSGSKSQHCVRCGAHENVTEIPKLDANVPMEYEFRILRNNGNKLSDPSIVITVYDGEEQVAQSTPSTLVNGVFRYSLKPKAYTVRVTNLPEGYSAEESVTMEPGDPYCDLYVTAAPIAAPVPSGKRYSVGSVMHDFVLTESMTTNGKRYTLSGLLSEKKVVVLNFWATWCGPCQNEFPYLEMAYRTLANDIELLAIDQDARDTLDTVKQFATANGYSFPMAYDSVNRLQSMFGVTEIPATVVIDAEGVVCEFHNNPMTSQQQFISMITPYLAGSGRESRTATVSRHESALPTKRDLAD